MRLIIQDIRFDVTEDDVGNSVDMAQDLLQVSYIGRLVELENPDNLADIISDDCGWLVNSISYEVA